MVATIWQKFLCQNSDTEVSLPSNDREATIERMENLDDFRNKVFEVALNDPIKTMRKDIGPRFIASTLFAELIQREEQNGNSKSLVAIEPPKSTIVDLDFDDGKTFTITEFVSDKYLYAAIKEQLDKRFSAENLLCLREIHNFEEAFDLANDALTQKLSWSIYRNFIALKSPHEVSCSSFIRKQIMHHLAKPQKDTFENIKTGCMEILNQDCTAFQESPDFTAVLKLMKTEKKKSSGGRFRVFNALISPRSKAKA